MHRRNKRAPPAYPSPGFGLTSGATFPGERHRRLPRLRLRRPALAARAALHVEHGLLDREQLAVALDQAGHRERCQVAAAALGHPDIAARDVLEVPEPGVSVLVWDADHEKNVTETSRDWRV